MLTALRRTQRLASRHAQKFSTLTYPSRTTMRPLPSGPYDVSAQTESQLFTHANKTKHPVYPLPVVDDQPDFEASAAHTEVEYPDGFTPSVFAVVDINTKQVKVNAGCKVMTGNLNWSGRKIFREEKESEWGVREEGYYGEFGERLEAKLDYFWDKLTAEEQAAYNVQEINVGDRLVFNDVLLLAGSEFTILGQPLVSGASVHATVEEQGFTEDVIVYKKKRRKGFAKQLMHNSPVTVLRIDSVIWEHGAKSDTDPSTQVDLTQPPQ
jgi:large subunit ribosomal protein L21